MARLAATALDRWSSPWGSWYGAGVQDGYGPAVEAEARRLASERIPAPRDARYERELKAWEETRRKRDNASKFAGAAVFIGWPFWIWFAVATFSGAIGGVIALGGLAVLPFVFHALAPERLTRPEAPRYTERESAVDILSEAIVRSAERQDRARRGGLTSTELRESVGGRWQPLGPRPRPSPHTTWREAEELCAAWLRWLGCDRVRVTQSTRDGGIDVTGEGVLAQVKNQTSAISPAPVRALHGVAVTQGKRGVFFAKSSFTRAAVAFADEAGVALFRFSPEIASLAACSGAAREILDRGLPSWAIEDLGRG